MAASAASPCSSCSPTPGLRIDEALSRDLGHLAHDRGHRILRLERKGDRGDRTVLTGRVVLPVVREHRRRAERALASVVAARYLLGVLTRRAGKLAVSLGKPPGPITSDVPRSRGPITEKSEGGHGRPPESRTARCPNPREN